MSKMQKRRDVVGTAVKIRQVCSSIITLWGLINMAMDECWETRTLQESYLCIANVFCLYQLLNIL